MAIEQQMEMFGTGDMGRLDDDGDAKLSDGEYVVPANVVRYYGVKFFEDLRNDAMQGLATMEATGRIGGEPVPAEMPMKDQMAGAANELSEQDMAMLQSMMNEGGVVQGYANGGGVDPVPAIATPAVSTESFLPQFSTVGASGVNQLADVLGGQSPVRAFVVSGDVSTAQQLDRNIIQSASLG